MALLIKLEDSSDGIVWLAVGEGDPPRCLQIENARRFPNRREALKALHAARQFRPFRRAHLIDEANPQSVFDQ